MSYDYERYDNKRIVVDGEIIGVLAMELGHEVEEVWEEYHAELAMTEMKLVSELRKLLLDVWNDALSFNGFWDYVHDDGEIYDECVLPHYQERMRELGIEVDDG